MVEDVKNHRSNGDDKRKLNLPIKILQHGALPIIESLFQKTMMSFEAHE